MSIKLDDLSRRLEMPTEQLISLFAIAGIDDPETNPSASFAKLSHFLAKRLVPKVQAEMDRIRRLVALEPKLAELKNRHEAEFGISPVLPEFIEIEGQIELMRGAFRLKVPNDDAWSALKRMYSEIFFAPPPRPDHAQIDVWVNEVLTAITLERPIKDKSGTEYVNSTLFRGRNAAKGAG